MSDSSSLVISQLRDYFESQPHGAIGEFCKATGIHRQSLKNWLSGTAIPLDAIDAIAQGLNKTPDELLKPAKKQPAITRDSLLAGIVVRLPALQDDQLRALFNIVNGFAQENAAVDLPEKLASKKHKL